MQAAPARYVSVSELYSTDEVELLLDEIRELEPTSCRGEDVQVARLYCAYSAAALADAAAMTDSLLLLNNNLDFEIAGSGCGGGGGGRSPAGTELTERSWDSHAQYLREPPPRPAPLAPLYCHAKYLLSLEGSFTLLIVASCVCACALVWGAEGARLGGGARPLALGALSSWLLHAALLLLRLSRLHRLMPLDWPALGMYSSLWTLVSAGAGASVLLCDALAHHAPARALRLAAAGAGYAAALAGGALAGLLVRRRCGPRRGAGVRGAYRAVPTASPAPAPAPAPPPPAPAPRAADAPL